MLNASDFLSAASEIRPHLDELLEPALAVEVRVQLDEVLETLSDDADEKADAAADAVVGILGQHAQTRVWMGEYMGLDLRGGSLGGSWASGGSVRSGGISPASSAPVGTAESAAPVYARIECPQRVVTGKPFEATVGLSSILDPDMFSTVFDLPPGNLTLTVHVTADGIDLLPGQTWRNDLPIAEGAALPSVTLRLAAETQDQDSREARIQALYLHEGQTVGFGSRSLVVAREANAVHELEQPSLPTGGTIAFPPAAQAPDLTVDIRRGQFPGQLMWVFHTNHGLEVPDEAPVVDVGQAPDAYARQLIARANQREGKSDLFPFLRGVGKEIADRVPPVLFTLLRDVAARLDRPPLVQLFSEEPYIPWELAWMKAPIDPAVPGFLGAQASVGRWLMAEEDPPFPAPASATGNRMAGIWGVYEGFPGWQRLVAAEEEGRQLTERYGATHVEATVDDVMACIKGTPQVDILHFAVHGNYDTQGNQNGLVLTDRRTLDPTVVRGLPMAGRPFVFLNACQVGTGQEILGDYGGMAMAFIKAGACGVVAPLWSINDEVAADLALEFYDKVGEGEPPASVMREARGAHGPEPMTVSGTYFAYQFFGHPAMTLALRERIEGTP